MLSDDETVASDFTYNFTMCNPPFFTEVHADDDITKTKADRTNHRPCPASISTATENESVTEGGEVSFVSRMINESLETRNAVRYELCKL